MIISATYFFFTIKNRKAKIADYNGSLYAHNQVFITR